MKKQDFIVILATILLLLPFFLSKSIYGIYCSLNQQFPLWMAFAKFGILATFGETLGNRIKNGNYYNKGFGLAPKFFVWGILGMWIALAMNVFRLGIPSFMERYSLFSGISQAMGGPISMLKFVGALSISTMMNTSFAPVFMTVHKISDMHIAENHGKLSALLKPINIKKHISEMDWRTQWGFVFQKTIPLFWIPAHTLTFCLPQDLQVLFAAFCSIILGLFLSIASLKKNCKGK